MTHKCHGKKEKFTAKKKSSRQKRKAHSKREKLTAKEKSSRQKRKAHGKKENLTAEKKTSRQKRKPHGKKENFTAKKKTSRQKRKARGGSKNSWRKLKLTAGSWLSLVFGLLHAVYNQLPAETLVQLVSVIMSFCSCGKEIDQGNKFRLKMENRDIVW